MVGVANEASIFLDGQLCSALLDTGSTVSTICQGFYDRILPNKPVEDLDTFLDIEGAGGQSLPYCGAVEVNVKLFRDAEPRTCMFLIVPDTRYGQKVPVILGTNILSEAMDSIKGKYGIQFQQRANLSTAWSLAFRCLTLQHKAYNKNDGRLGIIKCAESQKMVVPSNSSMTVKGFIDKKIPMIHPGCAAIVQPLDNTDLEITPTLLQYDPTSTHISVRLVNTTASSFVIQPRAVLCQLQVCEEVEEFPENPRDNPQNQEPLDKVTIDDSLNDVQRHGVQELLQDWKHIFSSSDTDIGFVSLVKHKIHLDNEVPFKQRHRKIPGGVYDEVRKHLKELLDANVIKKSHSPWASNIVLVRKKDHSLRLCVDYRQLNSRTVKDSYALPRIDDILEGLAGSHYFSVLDMKSGYHQIEIQDEHKPRSAFTVGPLGLYEYIRMPFGMSNAPGTYQRLMDECLDGLSHHICHVYLDDVIVFSDSFEEHVSRLRQVFSRLHDVGIKLSPKKCHMFQRRVKYVGHIVSSEGIEADPEKIEKIISWPVPVNTDDLRTYLGFTGYYRKFVRDYAKIARPMNDLLTGDVPKRKSRRKQPASPDPGWHWGTKQQEAFDHLKKQLTSPPILSYPDYTQPFILHTDACAEGLGAVLYQCSDGQERVIAYASRGLSKSERNYSAYKLEFLALKWAVTKKFNDFLYGSRFTVYTDNNPLTYILTSAKLDATGHRWVAALSAYDFTMKFRSGSSNRDADALSRLPGVTPEETGDYQEVGTDVVNAICQCSQVCHQFIDTVSFSTQVIPDDEQDSFDVVIHNRAWRRKQQEDPIIGNFLRFVTNKEKPDVDTVATPEGKTLLREFDHLVVRRGTLYRHVQDDEDTYQLVLPSKYREEALRRSHDHNGHFAKERVLNILKDRFYWPKMSSDVDAWLAKCQRCIMRKKIPGVAPMVSIHSSQPLEIVCMDFLTLEASKGFGHVLVITDHYTRYAVAIPTRNLTAKTTAQVFFNDFVAHYGIPKRIHSDQGANFTGKLIKELCQLTGMAQSTTTPYHPMGNGTTERFNRTLLGMLGCLEPHQKHDWKSHINSLVHSYNCTKHESTGFSPFQLMFGRKPRLAIDAAFGLTTDVEQKSYHGYVKDLQEHLRKSYDIACSYSKKSRDRQKRGYDLKSRGAVVETGDRVLVKIVSFDGKHKIADRWEKQPYIVQRQPNEAIPVYVVKREDGTGPDRTLHRNLLLPIGHLPLEFSVATTEQKDQPKASVASTDPVQAEVAPVDERSNLDDDSDDDVSIPDVHVHQPRPVTPDQSDRDDSSSEGGDEDEADSKENDEPAEEELTEDDEETAEIKEEASGAGEAAAAAVVVKKEPEVSVPVARPQPAPRPQRPQRDRRPPAWFRSGDYVTKSQVHQESQDWILKVQVIKELASDGTLSKLPSNACDAVLQIITGTCK